MPQLLQYIRSQSGDPEMQAIIALKLMSHDVTISFDGAELLSRAGDYLRLRRLAERAGRN